MIYYKKNKKNLTLYLNEITKLASKIPIILSAIFTPLAIFFLLVGYLNDKEALIFGYSSLMISVIAVFLILRIRFVLKRPLKKSFEDANENGDLEFTIELDADVLIVNCLNTGTISKQKKADIKK